MDDVQFKTLIEKLDFISNALLMNIIKDLDFKKQVITLHGIGLKEAEIVKFLNSSRDKVHGVLRNLK